MKTIFAKSETVKRDWYVIDATDKTLGRLATEAARRLAGKHKPTYTTFLDTGDHVIIVNAAKVAFTGRKLEGKLYRRHSGYMGHEKFSGKMSMVDMSENDNDVLRRGGIEKFFPLKQQSVNDDEEEEEE